jgi:hypothetical protein
MLISENHAHCPFADAVIKGIYASAGLQCTDQRLYGAKVTTVPTLKVGTVSFGLVRSS